MANRYLNTVVSRLKTSRPKTHVRPSNGSSVAEPLRRPSFAFLNVVPAVALVVPVLSFVELSVRAVFTVLDDNALRKARTKITRLI